MREIKINQLQKYIVQYGFLQWCRAVEEEKEYPDPEDFHAEELLVKINNLIEEIDQDAWERGYNRGYMS